MSRCSSNAARDAMRSVLRSTAVALVAVACAKPPASEHPRKEASSEPMPKDPPPPVILSPFSAPVIPQHPNDLGWLVELVEKLAYEVVTREHVIAYFGTDGGAGDSRKNERSVRPHSPYFAKISVYPLSHVKIEVAMDIKFAEGSKPGRSAVEKAIGPLQNMPRAPDDFSSGEKLSLYVRGKLKTTRVFVELDRENNALVKGLHVDADGP